MHRLSKLEARVLETQLSRLGFEPLGTLNKLAVLTELVKMCHFDMNMFAQLGVGDPAYSRFARTTMDLRKTINLLARCMTENSRDLAIMVDVDQAARYSLKMRYTGANNVERGNKENYVSDLASITHCKLLRNHFDVNLCQPWPLHCSWLLPTDKTNVEEILDYLRSDNIPYEFEAKSILEAIGGKPMNGQNDAPAVG